MKDRFTFIVKEDKLTFPRGHLYKGEVYSFYNKPVPDFSVFLSRSKRDGSDTITIEDSIISEYIKQKYIIILRGIWK